MGLIPVFRPVSFVSTAPAAPAADGVYGNFDIILTCSLLVL